MYPDLSQHWPTEEYNVFINWLRECHKNYNSHLLIVFSHGRGEISLFSSSYKATNLIWL
uniref:Uncharacterized protein n=1 Tax=Panthera leo TaxID=9689 RepID=A0A8C9D207_PANLE